MDLNTIGDPSGVSRKSHLAIAHAASQQLRLGKRHQRTAKLPNQFQMQALSFNRDIDLLTACGIAAYLPAYDCQARGGQLASAGDVGE